MPAAPLRCLECELTQDEGSGQELLLTSRYAIPSGRSLEEERHVCAVRPDRCRAQPLVPRARFDELRAQVLVGRPPRR